MSVHFRDFGMAAVHLQNGRTWHGAAWADSFPGKEKSALYENAKTS
jgi:hypothetical protein